MKISFKIYLLSISMISFSNVIAQDENLTWKGNKSYRNRDYSSAQQSYEHSLNISPSNTTRYNLANSLYKQQKYNEAAEIYNSIATQSDDKLEKAEAYHNLGNAMMKSKQLDKGIEAYKQALRNNPQDEDTRYNLSYALKLKKEQEKKEDQEQDQDEQEQNQDQQQQKEEQEKKDNEKQEQEQEQQQQEQKEQEQEQEQAQPKPQEQQISKEDARRLLENMENEEEKTREKVQILDRKQSNKNIENDW